MILAFPRQDGGAKSRGFYEFQNHKAKDSRKHKEIHTRALELSFLGYLELVLNANDH